MARELIILPRFKRDYRTARKHPDFDVETLEYVFDVLISGENLPSALREHCLITKVDTDLGQLALWWDTASGFSFVSQKVVERGHVQASKEDVRTQRLVFGGFDFGPWRFKWMDMSLPPFFDGSVGHDFFATQVVCIDFPDKRVVIRP